VPSGSSSSARDTRRKLRRIAVGHRSRFVGADDVVGNCGDADGGIRLRTQRPERMKSRHRVTNYVTRLRTCRDWGLSVILKADHDVPRMLCGANADAADP